MGIRQGKESDIDAILDIKNRVVKVMQKSGNPQWTEEYPNKEIFLKDIKNRSLYIYEEDEEILGFIVADDNHAYEYDDIPWELTRLDSIAFHRAAVNPDVHSKGIATRLMENAEEMFKEKGYLGVHSDTSLENIPMQRLFEKRGYLYRGKLNLHNKLDRWYVAYEKVF